ncbi:MAG: right-handed parallel beta-helix repeat-containing protein [Chloroflexi bacterium]|nr:right-handed parallel beta-helix repeat-containing protein [Chloroflexota bacterium]
MNAESNRTISGMLITNPNGDCIAINNSKNISIKNSEIGPCQGEGVSILSSSEISITQNRIEDVRTAVYVVSSQTTYMSHNQFLNVQGPMPRGQFVQFNQVSGPGNRINYNDGKNILGQSFSEDAINLFKSGGVSDDPLQILGNRIIGGGPSDSGGGNMAGDRGGSHIIVKKNILVDPGQYGIAIAGGFNIQLLDNKIYARKQFFTNVGLYVWAQPASNPVPCGNITV